jgi:hypothetical protein
VLALTHCRVAAGGCGCLATTSAYAAATLLPALTSYRAVARGELAGTDYTCLCNLLAAAQLLALTSCRAAVRGELAAGADCIDKPPPGQWGAGAAVAPSSRGLQLGSPGQWGPDVNE